MFAPQIATTSLICQRSPPLNSGQKVQKMIITTLLTFHFLKSTLSSCDSRNLNLSPFCNLSSTSLAMWQPSVLETYGNLTTDYINKTTGPLRLNYPNSMGDRELVSSLTKVLSHAPISTRILIRTKCTTTPTKGTLQL